MDPNFDRPNVVVILTDDQPKHTIDRMPILKALMRDRGTEFGRAYVADPLCSPNRASLLLGRFLHNHGIKNNKRPTGGARAFADKGYDGLTYGKALRDSGYLTGYFGKWFNDYGGAERPAGWDRWYALVENRAGSFDVADGNRVKTVDKGPGDESDHLAAHAANWVARRSSPFLCVFSTPHPHGPYGPGWTAARHRDDFDGVSRPSGRPYDDSPEVYRPADTGPARHREDYEGKLEELRVVDDNIRRIVSAVDSLGQLGNTYFFFLSDNGWFLGEHGLDDKGKFYDESSQTPFVVRGPGVPEGVVRPELVSAVDLYPTILDIAGLDGSDRDGRSVLPLLRGESTRWRKRLLVEHGVGQHFRMVREEALCYVEAAGHEPVTYDMVEDPQQRRNAYDTLPEDEKARRATTASELGGCSGLSCRAAEEA